MSEKSYKLLRKQILEAPHAFALLGVSKHSSAEELSKARRDIARIVHPDVNSAPDADELMARVNAAHAVLETNMKRYLVELSLKPCEACKGEGVLKKQKGFTKMVATRCTTCQGAGGVLREKK